MISYYIWLTLFAIFLYLILTDASVAQFVVISGRWCKLQYEKVKWWILHNPRNPVVKYLMWRRSMKIAEELMKEYQNDRMD